MQQLAPRMLAGEAILRTSLSIFSGSQHICFADRKDRAEGLARPRSRQGLRLLDGVPLARRAATMSG